MTSRLGFTLLLLMQAIPAWSAWVGICPGADAGTILERYLRPDGTAAALVVANDPQQGCDGISVEASAGRVRWGRLIPRAEAAAFAGGITLRGMLRENRLEISEVAPLVETATRPAGAAAGTELLPLARLSVFGVEERAEARAVAGGITLECRSGTSPAGVVIAVPEPEPPGMRLALRAKHRGQGSFAWGAADAARAGRGDPVMLGSSRGDAEVAFAIPAAVAPFTGSYAFTVVCPAEAARIEIASLKLEPETSPVPRRAFWVWQPEAWVASPRQLLDRAARLGAGTIYITVPTSPDAVAVADPRALSEFVAQASARGISIWAVAGDPRAVLPSERPAYVRLARAYAAYNSQAPVASRLSGVQFDIEPYLNPGYQLDVSGWLSAYLDTLAELKRETPVPLEVAVPFWWSGQNVRGASLLEQLAPLVDGIAVMNYRTDPELIRRFAEPFLSWGARHGRQVRIALESGPIPDEVSRHYRPASAGSLWQVPFGERALIVLLDGAAPNSAGTAFAYSHQTPAAGSAITFKGRARALRELLPALESTWSAWPGFAGIALHEPEDD